MRKFRGTIIALDRGYAMEFFKGVRAYEKNEVWETIGNSDVGSHFVDMLRGLGHTVEYIDGTVEDGSPF